MSAVLFLVSVLLPTGAGYVLLYREQSLSRVERVILSFGAGTGLLSFYWFALMLLGLPVNLVSALPFFAAFAAAAAWQWGALRDSLKPAVPAPKPELRTWWTWLLGALTASKVLFAGFVAVALPSLYWDAYTLWNVKAKAVHSGLAPAQLSEALLGDGFGHYPLHVVFVRAWLNVLQTEWSDAFADLHAVLLLGCLLAITWCTLRRELGLKRAAIATWLLSTVPLLTYDALSGYAELAVAFYFQAAVVLLFHFYRVQRPWLLTLAGLFAALAAFTKLEGVVFVLPAFAAGLGVVLLHFRPDARQTLRVTAPAVGLLGLVVLWLWRGGALAKVSALALAGRGPFSFHPEGLAPLANQLWVNRSFGLFWFVAPALVAWKFRAAVRSEARVLLLPAAVACALVLYVYPFTENVHWLIEGTAFSRSALLCVPVLALGLGLLWGPQKTAD